jgi:hypothetical protein
LVRFKELTIEVKAALDPDAANLSNWESELA